MARPRRAYPGQAIVEYSMIIAFICLGCIAAINYLQRGVSEAYETQQETLAEPTFSASNYIPPATMTMTPTRTPTFAPTSTKTPTPIVTPVPTTGAAPTSTNTPTSPGTLPSPTVPVPTATVPPTATTIPPTATTVPTATATTRPPTATATSVPPTATTVPTATATVNTATQVTITAKLNTDPSNNQNTQYWVQLNNTGNSAVSNMSARVYLNLSEIIAAGYSANNVVIDEYWDQCGTASLSGPVTWDAARKLFYININWQSQSFTGGSSCQIQFGLHLSDWRGVWNGTNDPSQAGLGTGNLTQTTAIPAYRNGTKVYGNEP